ncbi:MAG TPA: ribosome maturation factor RimP [Pyrinomonadaceae bacterium]|mgnify:CR=1 FL=1|nr:ribosome maturation factor RimP [Pyrinomonadaceae bacterium]
MLDSLTVDRIRELAAKVAKSNKFELVHVEIAGTKRDAVVRIFIDKTDGITLDDCSSVSGEIGELLDAEDLIPGRYVLEVSSPGIERELYSIGDMKRFAGRLIKAKMRNAYNGQKTFVGEMTSVDGDEFTMDDRTIGKVTLPFRDVQKANLKIDLREEFKRR